MSDDYSRSANGEIFINHGANWPRYVRDNPNDLGAQMLASTIQEIDRLRKLSQARGEWAGRLLYAYVMSWNRLRSLMVNIPPRNQTADGISHAWNYIQILNEWRRQHPNRDEAQ
jgi:peptidoglycan/xylan/chitin deacetylase (PgdA/CDA1 family)